MTGAAMVSAALYERARTGQGQVVSTSLLRQGAYTIGFDVNVALMWGRTIAAGVRETMRQPDGEQLHRRRRAAPFWIVGLEGDRHWPALARAVGPARVADDRALRRRPATGPTTPRELIAELDAHLRHQDRATSGPSASPPSPSCSGRRSTRSTTCSATSSSTPPGRWSRSPTRTAAAPCWPPRPTSTGGRRPRVGGRPQLGEHTREVLAELGRSQDAIDRSASRTGVATGPPGDPR